MSTLDLISVKEAGTIAGLFACRVVRTPQRTAYRYYQEPSQSWIDCSWSEVAEQAARWQQALRQDGLQAGDRVAIMLNNSLEWVLFDLAASGLGLITVPLYVNDRPEKLRLHPGINQTETAANRRPGAVATLRTSQRKA